MATPRISDLLGRSMDQVAFVVADLDEGQRTFGALFGIDRWSVWRDQADGQVNRTYHGEPEEFGFSCGYAYAGDILIELCHHDRGRTIYRDWLDTRGEGMNHVGFRVADESEFAEVGEHMEEQGVAMAMGGERRPGNGYAYFDTVDTLGCYTEIYYVTDAILDVFARMKRGEVLQRPVVGS